MKIRSRPIHRIALGALASAFLLAAPASATRLIPFQGRVTDGAGAPLEGVFRVTFTIYDEPTGGTELFAESHANVSVIGGQINVLLGSLVSLDDPNGDQNPADTVQFNEALKPRFLGIKVGADSNQEMVPRHQLVPSFQARIADTTADGGVGTDQIADGAVTFPKLDADALAAIIPPGSIMPYGGATAPPGWVLCDGSQYEGTDAQFEKLFAAIGTTFGGGGTSFNVPDLRGQFLRGLDPSGSVDPDGASRSVGSMQGSAIPGLTASTSESGNHIHVGSFLQAHVCPGGQDCATGTGGGGGISALFGFFPSTHPNVNGQQASGYWPAAGNHSHSVAVSPTSGVTSTETRPKNVAVNYIVKL